MDDHAEGHSRRWPTSPPSSQGLSPQNTKTPPQRSPSRKAPGAVRSVSGRQNRQIHLHRVHWRLVAGGRTEMDHHAIHTGSRLLSSQSGAASAPRSQGASKRPTSGTIEAAVEFAPVRPSNHCCAGTAGKSGAAARVIQSDANKGRHTVLAARGLGAAAAGGDARWWKFDETVRLE